MLPEGLLPEGLLKEFDLEIPDCQLIDPIEQGVRQREDRQAPTPTSLLSAGGWGGPPGPEFRAMLTQPPAVPQSPALNPRAKTFIPITSGDSPRENNAPTPSFLNPERWGGPPQPTTVPHYAVPPQPIAVSHYAVPPQPTAVPPQPTAVSPQPTAVSPQPTTVPHYAVSPQPTAVSLQPPLIGGLPGFESWIKNSLDELHKCIFPVLRSPLDEMKLKHLKTTKFLNQYSDNLKSITFHLKVFKSTQYKHKRKFAVDNLILQIDSMVNKEGDVTFRQYFKSCEDTWGLKNNREWKEEKRKTTRFFQKHYIIDTLKASFKCLDFKNKDNKALLNAVCKNLIDRSSDAGECSYTIKQKPQIPNNSIPMRLINAILQYEVESLSRDSASIAERAETLIRGSKLQNALLTLDPSPKNSILRTVLESSGFQYPEKPPIAPDPRLFPPRIIDVEELLSKIDIGQAQEIKKLDSRLCKALLAGHSDVTMSAIDQLLAVGADDVDSAASDSIEITAENINLLGNFYQVAINMIRTHCAYLDKAFINNVAYCLHKFYDQADQIVGKQIEENSGGEQFPDLMLDVGRALAQELKKPIFANCCKSQYLRIFMKSYLMGDASLGHIDTSHEQWSSRCLGY